MHVNENEIEILTPDDWHCHLRDGAYLATTVPMAAKQFKRVVAMPNLMPPIITVQDALQYRERIMAYVPSDSDFTPLMTLYLTDDTTPMMIREAANANSVLGCKLYPAGVTTHSDHGVNQIERLYPLFSEMQAAKIPLLVHGEVNDSTIDIYDREAVFIERHLQPLLAQFPELKVVLEHITTAEAVDFVQSSSKHVAATITPHHLLLNRNAMFVGGINPHHYCLPILKRHTHQAKLIQAATSGNPHFFIGTDSAPHAKSRKESGCGCAGIYHGNVAIELYVQVFDQAGALDKLEGFCSRFGADFYGLPYNQQTLRIQKSPKKIPEWIAFGDEILTPFMAGLTLPWQAITS